MPDIESIRTVVRKLGERYGAERICLFGSYARGEMTESSDIDLSIDKGDIRGLRFASLLCDLEDALGKPVDLVSKAGADKAFLDRIEKDEVLLYERG